MLKPLHLTTDEELLVHNCMIGQLQSLFDCESCPYYERCSDFIDDYQIAPIQAFYSCKHKQYVGEY